MEWLEYIYVKISTVGNSIVSVLSYVWSIFQGIWYGLKTLLSGVFDIIGSIFNSGIFNYVYEAFNYLAFYVGDWGASLLASILFIIIIRIFIAFVYKIFRFNVNYTTMQDRMNRSAIANDPRRDKSPRS